MRKTPHHRKGAHKKAEKLRAGGKSYREIKTLLGVPKSTLSNWLSKKYPFAFTREEQLKHLSKIRPLAIAQKKREQDILANKLSRKVTLEIKTYPLDNIGFYKTVLAALYWAEGAKHKGVSGLKFANTDPRLALFYISLLRKCYPTNPSKFRVRLHLHHYHKPKAAIKFWSELLTIPTAQFGKIYIKKRSKTKRFRKNFNGICFIAYLDSNIRKELLEIIHQIQTTTSAVPVAQRIERFPAEEEVTGSIPVGDAKFLV